MPREGISRRTLLRRGGAAAALAAGAGAGAYGLASRRPSPDPGPPPPAGPPGSDSAPGLRKGISMGSYAPIREEGHPNDYRLHGNREYIRDLSATRWVKLWVSWGHLQEELRPASRRESWTQLNRGPGADAALARLDRLVRAVNDDGARVGGGIGVILTLYHEYPTWAGSALRGRGRRPVSARVPDDLSPEGPFGWMIDHLCARYRPGARANPIGPHLPRGRPAPRAYDPAEGNPLGARVDMLEVCNEPNTLLWPQRAMPGRVAEMIVTATELSARLGGPGILGPATADFPDPPRDTERATDWRTFTERLCDELPGGAMSALAGWSHHNYLDVKEESSWRASRARRVIDRVERAGFAGRLWLTEGGYDLYPDQDDSGALADQARKIERSFREMSRDPRVFLWTQHAINDDPANRFKSGLRADFVPGEGPGPPRPAWDVWRRLPAPRGA